MAPPSMQCCTSTREKYNFDTSENLTVSTNILIKELTNKNLAKTSTYINHLICYTNYQILDWGVKT